MDFNRVGRGRWAMVLALATGACATEAESLPLEPGEAEVDPADRDAAALFNGDPANGAVFAVDISHWEGPMAQSEMDCFWDQGVRHVVSGTQVTEVTRQQLAMAVRRGMTVDAYVYLYWNRDMAEQVREAFRRVEGFPIGRMWLDVEEAPGGLGANTLIARTQEAVDACTARGTSGCGIYTGPGFWKSYMNNTTAFAHVPLWYAWYNYKTSLSHWSTEKFGGWAAPEAKQWAEEVLCAVGVDKNTMRVVSVPSVVVDRSLQPAPTAVPAAPANPWPADGSVVSVDYLKMMADAVPHGTGYQFALENWDGAAWRTYHTWSTTKPFTKTYPAYRNSFYRFRARAKNARGYGEWTAWNTLQWGSPSVPSPAGATSSSSATASSASSSSSASSAAASSSSASSSAASSSSGGAPPPPPADGAPTGLAPDDTTLSTTSVTMTCSPIAGATRYEFTIEYGSDIAWRAYSSYSSANPSRTFWPQVRGTTYRWKVRRTDVADAPWSAWATFGYP